MTNLVHTIALHLGADGSGHRYYSVHRFVSNRTQKEVIANHAMASRMYSIQLYKQCRDYENDYLTHEFHARILEIFQDKPEFRGQYLMEIHPDDEAPTGYQIEEVQFAELYLQIASMVDPGMEWADAPPDSAPHHIGGYGLFFT